MSRPFLRDETTARLRLLLASLTVTLLLVGCAWAGESTAAQPKESAEEFALRYVKTVTADHDRDQATEMLCREQYPLLKANLDNQIDFWQRREVVVQPHDFHVVKSIELPNYDVESSPTHRVWVAYAYTYLYEGEEIDIDLSEGYHIDVDQQEESFCAMPLPDS